MDNLELAIETLKKMPLILLSDGIPSWHREKLQKKYAERGGIVILGGDAQITIDRMYRDVIVSYMEQCSRSSKFANLYASVKDSEKIPEQYDNSAEAYSQMGTLLEFGSTLKKNVAENNTINHKYKKDLFLPSLELSIETLIQAKRKMEKV